MGVIPHAVPAAAGVGLVGAAAVGYVLWQPKVAYVPALPSGWVESPYEQDRILGAGFLQIHTRSYRASAPRGVVNLVTVNHPRPVRVDLAGVISHAIPNIVWGQSFMVRQEVNFQLPVTGGLAEATLWELAVSDVTVASGVASNVVGAPLPDVGAALAQDPTGLVGGALQDSLFLLVARWGTGDGPVLGLPQNDHILVGVANAQMLDAVLNVVPLTIAYV